jgi:hypothetical protein
MQNLHLELKPSRYLLFIVLILHLGAILCIVLANLSYLCKAACILVTIINIAVFYFKRKRWTHLSWNKKEGWKLVNAKQDISVQLEGDSIRMKWVIILNFRCKDFPCYLS